MATVIHHIDLIVSNPEIRSGRPCIAETGITVADVAIAKVFHKKDADEIAEWYDLTLPQVYSALAYYYTHKGEIDESIQDRRDRALQLKEQLLAKRPSLLP